MKTALVFGIVFALFLPLVGWSEDIPEKDEKEIEVVMGIDKVIKLDFVPDPRVSVNNQAVLTFTLIPQKKELIFKGLKPDKTSVIVRDTVGDVKARFLVRVSTDDKSKVVSELRELLGEIEGLEIGIKGGIVYVGGQIVVPRDIGRVATILDRYKDVMRLVELSPQTQRVIAAKMQAEIHKNGLADIKVRIVNGVFWLEGVTDKADGDKLAMSIAKAYLPDRLSDLATSSGELQSVKRDPIISFISVNTKDAPKPVPKQIKIIAQFVELAKDYMKGFGFQWAPTLAGDGGSISIGKTGSGGVTTSSSGTLAGTIANLFPKLNSATQAGYARIVQSGMVLTKADVAAMIKKDSRINYSVGGKDNAQAVQDTVGFNMEVTPKIVEAEKVELGIALGVSMATGAAAGGTTPLTTQNNIKTNVVVNNKESAVIGGVVQSETHTLYDKTPPGGVQTTEGTGQLLFNLIKSKSFTNNKNQFVIFVTPEIVESASASTEDVRRKFRRRGK